MADAFIKEAGIEKKMIKEVSAFAYWESAEDNEDNNINEIFSNEGKLE